MYTTHRIKHKGQILGYYTQHLILPYETTDIVANVIFSLCLVFDLCLSQSEAN